MIYFVGAGCGAADLITVRGMKLLQLADVIIYAGSLVNPELLEYAKDSCEIYNSATMTLDEVMEVMLRADKEKKTLVRLHTGEPSIYGAVQEQMHILDENNIAYESCPGVSACFGAAAALNLEYTLPDVSQSLIITRMEGRTAVPEKESIESFAAHGASMAIYLSAGMLEELQERLIKGGYDKNTPAAIVYKATLPDEEKYICTVGTLANTAKAKGISNLAVILVGNVIAKSNYSLSKLYDPTFETMYRTHHQSPSVTASPQGEA
ncbi:cobalt-precorrin 4 C11-methyltransferase [Pseudobutyrivibrio sp. 49]|uniref:precorrin-4 C(11)-methyltransferase n=1 Tax=Pseudobutyrivibrio sp. 49 TaxID=1855344 RepID=UPI00088C4AE5|nr:precorrin-4 C(11)-methyltransferase [Pseudobutyrivibrio sp. 49]SDH30066.1 cobalt-precorrin 4 C11-methyltransferase [Pseudobutyrivibrio sp. 49]